MEKVNYWTTGQPTKVQRDKRARDNGTIGQLDKKTLSSHTKLSHQKKVSGHKKLSRQALELEPRE